MMGKDPAVLFYTSDFISGTLTMSDEQRGKYIILLCLQHEQGLLSYEDMINICKTYDAKIFNKFIKTEEGMYYNERMKNESDKRKLYSESRKKNRINICKTYDKHMENENVNENDIVIKKPNYHFIFEKVLKDNNIELPPEFFDLILEWLKYKSEKGQTYKETGLKSFIIKAMTDCGGSAGTLKNMILYSTSNNYSGLFKEQKNGSKINQGNHPVTTEELASITAKNFGKSGW
jgi:hypothetical protein